MSWQNVAKANLCNLFYTEASTCLKIKGKKQGVPFPATDDLLS